MPGPAQLPATAAVVRDVRRLASRVRLGGGTAQVLRMAFTDPAEEQAMIAELNAAREAEHAEVLERLPELHRELASEQDRGRVTYAEVEESEADLHRFQVWLAKMEARDYFGAAGGDAARPDPARRREVSAAPISGPLRQSREQHVPGMLLASGFVDEQALPGPAGGDAPGEGTPWGSHLGGDGLAL